MLETQLRSNPFPGLRSFEPDEDHLFFGRESRIDEILTRLRRSRFLSVVGTSGSGKSSLIRSGLIPSLHSGVMAKAGSAWRIAIFRPGENPIGNLAEALNSPDVVGPEEDADTNRSFLEVTLRRSAMGLVECIRQARIPKGENVLVLVDQFEELFRFKSSLQQRDSRDEAVSFVKLLLTAIAQQELPVYVVITMRSDFIGNCTEFEGLTEAINEGQYLVPRMTRDERRSAIVGPVAVGGAEITPRLVLRLLNDVGDDPDQLPILQHALMRTWDYWEAHHADGEPIDLRHYEAIGTMTEALSRHAEEAFLELETPERRTIAEKMFKALTDRGSDARGVRNPRRFDEICALTGAGAGDAEAVIEVFRKPGRSFLMPPASSPLRPSSIVDISHESLMRIWARLIQWVDEEARSAQVYLRISRTARRFQEGKVGLLRDPELQLDLNWREETQPNAMWAERYDPAFERAMLFLDQSKQQRDLDIAEKERQRRRQLEWARRLAIILGSAAIVTLVFGLYAMTLKIEAEDNFKEALRQKEIALAQQKEAEHQRSVADEQRGRAEDQRQRADKERDFAEEQKQIALEQEQEALRQKAQAEAARSLEAQARTEAESQRAFAVEQKDRAETLRVKAETSETETRRLRMLAVARGLALQTTRLAKDEQKELAALLAAQAFRLHEKNGGSPDDAQLFEALRAALTRLAPETAGVLRLHQDAVRTLALAPGGRLVASGSDDGSVRVFGLDAAEPGSRLVASLGSEVRAIAWVDGGKHLAAGTLDGRVFVLDASAEGERPAPVASAAPGLTALAYRADGDLLASASLNGEVTLWSPGASRTARSLQRAGEPRVAALAFTTDGRLVGASDAGGLVVWDPGRPDTAPRRLLERRKLRSLAVAPDGSIAAGTVEGPILVLTRGNEDSPVELAGHSSGVTGLRFGADGARLASSSLDGTVRLWDVRAPGREPIVLAGHSGWVWTVALSPDGTALLSGGADRTIRSWPTRAQPMLEGLCARVSRNLTPEEWSAFLPADIPWQPTCAVAGRRSGPR
jgi:cell division protein FtsN